MIDITEEKLDELFLASPAKTQDFITSGNLEKAYVSIENTHGLTENESRVVQEESLAYLIGAATKDDVIMAIALSLRSRQENSIQNILKQIEDGVLDKRHIKNNT